MQLIKKTLEAGSIDKEKGLKISKKGTPQGSVLSPLLANIVLHELDKAVEKMREKFEKGTKRKKNPEYNTIQSRLQNLCKTNPESPEIKELVKRKRITPSVMAQDADFKRMKYIRYADDFVILILGSKDEAKMIKGWIKSALKSKCGLELNDEKTLVTATKDGFSFLGA